MTGPVVDHVTDPVVEPASGGATTPHAHITAEAERLRALGETAPRLARDPVNQPQIHTWLEAIGDRNPAYRDTPEAVAMHGGPVAPPAMAQVWTMYGLGLPGSDPQQGRAGDPLHQMMQVLDEAGFTSVLGTNCDQTYERYLRAGEHVSVTTRLDTVVGPKRTAVGEGYFVTTRSVWRVGEEPVATMLFRVLKYRPSAKIADPGAASPASAPLRPMVNRDSAYFWEGTSAGQLRIQRCEDCGVLRHPPGPMCPACRSTRRGWVPSSGRGSVYSYVVHRAPQIPGRTLPVVIGVVELEDGVRMVGELRGVAPESVEIGLPVEVGFERVDDEVTLPVWHPPGADLPRPVDASQGARPLFSVHNPALQGGSGGGAGGGGVPEGVLPGWELPITTTFVVSTALATRDYQDVHHDRDLAVQRGSKDIFLNILTTTGLVQRYVGEWAGPSAVTKACELRLGAPAHPGDTLSFAGTVRATEEVDGERRTVVDVVGSVPAGAHVTARVTVVLPDQDGGDR